MKIQLFRSVLFCTCALSPCAQALAQSSDAPATGAQSGQIEDIVVTAQRRDERLQDVPIAVSALSSESALRQGISDTMSLTAAVPSLTFTRNGSSGTIFIRGIGTTVGNTGNEPSVATYVDGVYRSAPNGNMLSLANIERVEVLRGPQGTLFGRNATGGVVQIITKKPSTTQSANVSMGYANYDTVDGSLYVTAGITDNIATDFAFYGKRQFDGWGRNLTTGQELYTGYEAQFRNQWAVQFSDRTDARLAFDFSKTRTQEGMAYHIAPGALAADGVTRDVGDYNTVQSPSDFSRIKQWGGSGQINHDLDWMRLTSITSYRSIDGYFTLDSDATPSLITLSLLTTKSRTWSQEFQAQSQTDSKVQWIIGSFLFRDVSQYDPLRSISATSTTDIFGRLKTESWAVYGQATVPLGVRTNITGGLRYTSDKRSISGSIIRGGVTLSSAAQSKTFSKITWKVSLDHKLSDDIMVYASNSRGFKSGGYDTISFAAPAFKPEVLDANEIGLKSDLFDKRLRLNLSLFDYRYKDIQVSVFLGSTTSTINAANAKIQGLEFELVGKPSEALTLRVGGTVLDAHYKNFRDAVGYFPRPTGGNLIGPYDASGQRTVQTPKFVGTGGIDYSVPTSIGTFVFSGNLTYNDGFFWDPQNLRRTSSYYLANASLSWSDPTEVWTVRLWGRNLADERYPSFYYPSSLGDRQSYASPRTYGITISRRFGG